MFKLTKEFRFEASHQLKDHDGKCANLHGHSWRGTLTVKGYNLAKEGPKRNMLLDYSILGQITTWIEATYDHKHLNDVLKDEMPTSELLAKTIFEWARVKLQAETDLAFLHSVSIEETCTTHCEYHVVD